MPTLTLAGVYLPRWQRWLVRWALPSLSLLLAAGGGVSSLPSCCWPELRWVP
nr:hypothetical protein [Hymenobacter sp. 5516J-16]